MVPGSGDDVTIDVDSTTIVNGYFDINSLTCNASLDVAGELKFEAPSTVHGDVSITQGTLFAASNLDMGGNLSLDGSLIGPGTVGVGGTFTWSAGEIDGGATIQAAGNITLNNTNPVAFNSGTIDNAGVATWTGASIGTVNGVWNNLPGSTFVAQTTAQFLSTLTDGWTPMFNNAGTFRMSAGTAGSNAQFNNTGKVDVESGQLTIDVGTSSGTFEAGNDGTLVLRGQLHAPTPAITSPNAGGTLLFEEL